MPFSKRFSLLIPIALAMALVSPLARAKKSVTENLVHGAVLVANGKLFANPEDQRGLDLLRFALALDPENRSALLIQAKLDRDQKLDDARFADGGAQYVKYVLNVAKHTRSKKRRLLLYKVVELVSPKNETAMLELTKAKNKGRDVSFNALVQVILPDEEKDAEDEAEDEVAEEEDEQPAGGEDILDILERLTCRNTYLYHSNHIYGLNELNRALSAHRLSVFYDSKTNPIRQLTGYSSTHYETSRSSLPPPAYTGLQLYYSTSTARSEGVKTQGDWIRLFCAIYGKGWSRKGRDLVLVDADHKGIEKGSGIPVKAETLYDENKKGRLDFRRKYMGNRLLVSGFVSGVTNEYVHLASDRVRLVFDSSVKASRVDLLEADYERTVAEKRPMLFVCSGKCETIRTGRIHITGCETFSWATSYVNPN